MKLSHLPFALLLIAGYSYADISREASPDQLTDAYYEHEKLFRENKYPSAATCRTCHPEQYREWSVSSHAYAQMSPMLQAMQGTVIKGTAGTAGDFCVRCHSPASANMNEAIYISNLDRHPAAREGITCIVCHRNPYTYGKVQGRIALAEGDIVEPVYGPTGNQELKRVLAHPETYSVTTDRNEPGRKIHPDIKPFFTLRASQFCASCHEVTLGNGLRLEVNFSQFKNSHAAVDGKTCQDCHMGLIPGRKSGYAEGPAAIVGGAPTQPRRRANHMFAGPDFSVIHPGIFPHNDKAAELATLREWLTFKHEEGWGTDAFEKSIPKDYKFPPHWTRADDRIEARSILDDQFTLLADIQKQRVAILREGYRLGDLSIDTADPRHGLAFAIEVNNGIDGHNVPTGFDNDRVVFLHITVADAAGRAVFESGDLDPNGDLRDTDSIYVHNGKLPLDDQLFNLQSKTIVRLPHGGERDQVLATNKTLDPLPFVRPEPFSMEFYGHPTAARIHRRSIEPLGHRRANYRVNPSQLTGSGPYSINVKLVAGMIPVNLVRAVIPGGFDYGMTPRQIGDAVKKGHIVLWDRTVSTALDGKAKRFELNGTPASLKAAAQNPGTNVASD